MSERRRTIRVPGHKLWKVEWNGERGAESSSTGYCTCGQWEESGSSQRVVRAEYRYHLRQKATEQATLEARLRS